MVFLSNTIWIFLIVLLVHEQFNFPAVRAKGEGKCGIRKFDDDENNYISFVEENLNTIGNRNLRRSNEGKIVGGRAAIHGEVPWQAKLDVVLMKDGKIDSFLCGGVIISEYWLLTAAHCVHPGKLINITVTVGNHHVFHKDEGEQQFYAEKVIVHENYEIYTKGFDITLIKIRRNSKGGIIYNEYVQPVCLPPKGGPFPVGQHCIISGWGLTNFVNETETDVLMAATVPILSRNKCKQFYPETYNEYSFCAGYEEGEIDACIGDSGGPLVCYDGDSYTLYGIVSWGRICATLDSPGIYTEVPKFIPWITTMINIHSNNWAEKYIPQKW